MLTEENVIYVMIGVALAVIFASGIIMTLLASSKEREEAAVEVQPELVKSSNAFRKGHRR